MSLFILIYFNFYSCRDVTRMRHNVPEIYERCLAGFINYFSKLFFFWYHVEPNN